MRGLLSALRPLVGAIPVAAMREANYMVDRDRDKRSPEDAARWLERRLQAGATEVRCGEGTPEKECNDHD
jgi:hypothetical protein